MDEVVFHHLGAVFAAVMMALSLAVLSDSGDCEQHCYGCSETGDQDFEFCALSFHKFTFLDRFCSCRSFLPRLNSVYAG